MLETGLAGALKGQPSLHSGVSSAKQEPSLSEHFLRDAGTVLGISHESTNSILTILEGKHYRLHTR